MKLKNKLRYLNLSSLTILLASINVYSQQPIKIVAKNSQEATQLKTKNQKTLKFIQTVYKSSIDGRIITNEEFQSYKGVYTFIKRIKGKNGAIDTLLITPPNKNQKDKFLKVKRLEGTKVEPFIVKDIHGKTYNSNDLKGKVIVMNFWFINCPPCVKEIPELNKLVDNYEEVVFLAFALDDKEKLKPFLSKTNFKYNVIPDSEEFAKKHHIILYPTHIIIDKKGIIKHTLVDDIKNIENFKKLIENVTAQQ